MNRVASQDSLNSPLEGGNCGLGDVSPFTEDFNSVFQNTLELAGLARVGIGAGFQDGEKLSLTRCFE